MAYRVPEMRDAFAEYGTDCYFCDSDEIEMHNVDGDNGERGNLMPVCRNCHHAIHRGKEGYEEWHEKLPEEKRWNHVKGERGCIRPMRDVYERLNEQRKAHRLMWDEYFEEMLAGHLPTQQEALQSLSEQKVTNENGEVRIEQSQAEELARMAGDYAADRLLDELR